MNKFNKLINLSLKDKALSLPVNLRLDVQGETWKAYHVDIAHRDLLFSCDKGTCTFLVDSFGDRNTIELFDWTKN